MEKSSRLLLIILSCIFISLPVYAQERAKKKVAVYMTGKTSDADYKKVIGAKLVNAITESGEYAAVERTADFLAALSAESDYQTSGEVRDSQIARLGQKFGVRYVVVADASELFDEYFIAARLINVETGLVERAFDINGPADSMAQLVALSQKVAKGLLKGNSFTTTNYSSLPINLSLCVSNENTYMFITFDEWKNLNDIDRASYKKIGICFICNGTPLIIAMHDSNLGDWYYAMNNNAPDLDNLQVIARCIRDINNMLGLFGGDTFKLGNSSDPIYYYSSRQYGEGVKVVRMYDANIMYCGNKNYVNYNHLNRPVYNFNNLK